LSAEVVNVVVPPASVPVPSTVAPARNSTLPEGVGPLELTIAVKVTACPKTEGFRFEFKAVAVANLFTFCNSDFELDPKFASPLYAAVMEVDPRGRESVA